MTRKNYITRLTDKFITSIANNDNYIINYTEGALPNSYILYVESDNLNLWLINTEEFYNFDLITNNIDYKLTDNKFKLIKSDGIKRDLNRYEFYKSIHSILNV